MAENKWVTRVIVLLDPGPTLQEHVENMLAVPM